MTGRVFTGWKAKLQRDRPPSPSIHLSLLDCTQVGTLRASRVFPCGILHRNEHWEVLVVIFLSRCHVQLKCWYLETEAQFCAPERYKGERYIVLCLLMWNKVQISRSSTKVFCCRLLLLSSSEYCICDYFHVTICSHAIGRFLHIPACAQVDICPRKFCVNHIHVNYMGKFGCFVSFVEIHL